MKRILLATSIFFGVTAYSHQTDAVIVECANCSQWAEQLISDAKQAQQYLTEVASLQTQLNQYTAMIRQGLALPQSIYYNIQGDIAQVRNLANAASLLTGNSGSILTRLNSADGYANSTMYLPQNVANQFTQWANTLGLSNQTLGRVAAVQQQQEVQYAALQATALNHSTMAAGQMQAIQASNESLSLISSQLNQIQATDLAAAQAAASYNEIILDEKMIEQQKQKQWLSQPEYATTGWQRY